LCGVFHERIEQRFPGFGVTLMRNARHCFLVLRTHPVLGLQRKKRRVAGQFACPFLLASCWLIIQRPGDRWNLGRVSSSAILPIHTRAFMRTDIP
jgi:hypothetical protein